jgi:hypothetical protein
MVHTLITVQPVMYKSVAAEATLLGFIAVCSWLARDAHNAESATRWRRSLVLKSSK